MLLLNRELDKLEINKNDQDKSLSPEGETNTAVQRQWNGHKRVRLYLKVAQREVQQQG